MICETFAEGESILHRVHPAVRVIMATLYSFTVALTEDFKALGLAVITALLLIVLARLAVVRLARRLAAALTLLLVVWILVPFTYAGTALLQLGPLTVSRSGVLLCIQITCKTMAILMAFTALVATMPTGTLGHTLHGLGMPAKLVQLLLLAYRYIFVIEQEYQRLYRAAKIRNFRPASNLHTYKTYAYLVGMLFVRASERARRVHLAMKCRGFNGRFHTLAHYPPTAWNIIIAVMVSTASILILSLELFG